MGVHGFSKTFPEQKEITHKDIRGMRIAIDAMTLIYKAALGMKNVSGLTNPKGESTLYITVCISNIVKFHAAGAKQIWCFDFDPCKASNADFHNPAKAKELLERKKRRDAAKDEIKKLKAERERLSKKIEKPNLFTDSESESDTETETEISPDADKTNETKCQELDRKIEQHEKRAFSVSAVIINTVKLILNFCNIQWVEAPQGFEGECIAARLTQSDINMADVVFSSDTDVLLFGGRRFIRDVPRKKTWAYYDLETLLRDYDITISQLHRVAMVLGCDFYNEKKKSLDKRLFHGIGPKSVIAFVKSEAADSKFANEEVRHGIEHYEKKCNVTSLTFVNQGAKPFGSVPQIGQLINWLVGVQGFNRGRLEKQLGRVVNFKRKVKAIKGGQIPIDNSN